MVTLSLLRIAFEGSFLLEVNRRTALFEQSHTRMSPQYLPNIALAGSTGYLGSKVLSILVSPTFRSSFNQVILLKRQLSSSSSTAAQPVQTKHGVDTRYYDESDLPASLSGVDVLINTVGPTGHTFKDVLLRAIPQAPSIKLYIPSEFGVDHTIHDFPHPEWNHKKAHFELARNVLQGTNVRVCRIFIGLFIEASIGPWFGFDTKNAMYEVIGSADMPVSYTSLEDTGRVIASVAKLNPELVPGQLHVASETLTTREVAQVMEETGSTPIGIHEVDLKKYKDAVITEGTTDPSKYLRFLMAEGKIDHRLNAMGNDNELVNPAESQWKWKTMKEYATETKGRPWADYEWSADSLK